MISSGTKLAGVGLGISGILKNSINISIKTCNQFATIWGTFSETGGEGGGCHINGFVDFGPCYWLFT